MLAAAHDRHENRDIHAYNSRMMSREPADDVSYSDAISSPIAIVSPDVESRADRPDGINRLTPLPRDLIHVCMSFVDTSSLLRFGRVDVTALAAVDHTLAWAERETEEEEEEGGGRRGRREETSDHDDHDDDEDDDDALDHRTHSSVSTGVCSRSLASLTLGSSRPRRSRRVVVLHSSHVHHLIHASLVRRHAAIVYISWGASKTEMMDVALQMGLMSDSVPPAASKAFPKYNVVHELAALREVQHLDRLFVRRSPNIDVRRSLDDARLRELLQLEHIRRSLRGLHFSMAIKEGRRSNRLAYTELDPITLKPHQTRRIVAIPDALYLSGVTLQVMGMLPHLHTLSIDGTAAAYGVLPLLHQHLPHLTTLAFSDMLTPELPSSDIMSIGLCPRLHTLLLMRGKRWFDDEFSLRFFSQPLLRRNLRRLQLTRPADFTWFLMPVLRGLRGLRELALVGDDESLSSEFIAVREAVHETCEERATSKASARAQTKYPITAEQEAVSSTIGDGADAPDRPRVHLRHLIICGQWIEKRDVRRWGDVLSSLPPSSPLHFHFRIYQLDPTSPVTGILPFWLETHQQRLVEMRAAFVALVAAHPTRVTFYTAQPHAFTPTHLHPQLMGTNSSPPVSILDWVRLDRAMILPFPLTRAHRQNKAEQ